ncbi:hypothetical protein RQP46_000269 [Phenoliferia psychrophenolica]
MSMFHALGDKLKAVHLGKDDDPPQDEDAMVADSGEQAESDNDEPDDPSKRERTYSIVVNNTSGLPLQIVAWPARASKSSDYLLTTARGANFYGSVPPNGTVSLTDEPFKMGELRGPKHLDFRKRWGWVFLDLVHPDGTTVHLQVFLKISRKGVEAASIGRTDLDATVDVPMPSGELGKGTVEGTVVTLVVDESFKDIKNVVDDSTKKGKKEFPGKGVETSSYISHKLARASLLVGSEARYHEYAPLVAPSRVGTIKHSVHEIEGLGSRYIGAFVEHGGKAWWDGHVKVHPITGIAKGQGFDSTADTTAIFANKAVINYGFHDAGEGRNDQVYVYATVDHGSWIGDLIDDNKAWLDVPFSKLALPAAHDSGMFGPLDAGLLALIQQGQLGNALASHAEKSLATPLIHFLVSALEQIKLSPARVINNIALTQKDSFKDQLHIVIHTRKGVIHHQHAMVPGCTYLTFLTDILNFLGENPSETVFVEIKSDGFVVHEDKLHNGEVVVYSMIPSEAELAAVLEEARQATSEAGREVRTGSAADLDSPIGALIGMRKRLIIVDHVHYPDAWIRADSYDHQSYNTLNPATIIASLEKAHATPTANIKDDIRASLTYSDSSSLLTFMKPKSDRATYPWIATKTFNDPGNVVFLNDFVDGVLVEHAIDVSRQRAGL